MQKVHPKATALTAQATLARLAALEAEPKPRRKRWKFTAAPHTRGRPAALTPNEPAASRVASLAAVLLGPLHSLVALWLVGRSPPAVCIITGLPTRTILSVARGLVDYNLVRDDNWQETAACSTGAAKILRGLGQAVHGKSGEVGPRQSARQVLKARKRRAAQQLRRRAAAAKAKPRARVAGPGADAAAASVFAAVGGRA